MNLNDLARFQNLDPQNMRTQIDSLPDQLGAAWTLGQSLPLPGNYSRAERIVILGLGTEALAGEILNVLIADSCNIPVILQRGYELPAYVDGQSTLVVAMSFAGDDEEVLSAFDLADARGTKLLAITTGGELATRAEKIGAPIWRYSYTGSARGAIGWHVGLLLALVYRLGLVRDFSADVNETVDHLRRNIPLLGVDGPVVKNPAKRLAGQMIGRTPVIFGAGITAPVARRWKQQLNANGKSLATWDELPEMHHNALSGIMFPPPLMTKIAVVFLTASKYEHPRVERRWELTREIFLQEGIAPDILKMRGESILAQIMTGVQFGDYISYYVAMVYEADPTATPTIDELREKLASSR